MERWDALSLPLLSCCLTNDEVVVAVVRMTVVVMVGLMMVVEVGSEIMAAHHDEQHKAQYAQDNFSAHGQTSVGVSPVPPAIA